jgi:ketosteroid isomerase-like protein
LRGHGIERAVTRDLVIRYLQLVEAMDLDGVAALIHPDIAVIEHPNKLTPAGARYDATALHAAGERGKALMAAQRYAIRQLIVDGQRAAAAMTWTGTLKDGRTMTAEICSVIEVRDGKIWRQEQFDCFR